MKLVFYSGRDEIGSVELTPQRELVYAGPEEHAVRGIVEYYERITELAGEELLEHVLLHVRGQTRAVLVQE